MNEEEPASPPARRALHAACLAVLALATVFLYGALLHGHVLASHEHFRIPLRTYEYVREIGRGHWIPQVFPDAANGLGYAFPRFYPPVAYVISAGLAAVTGDAVWGANLGFFLSVLCSGLAMYYLVLVVTRPGKPLIALASSLIYISLPYRFVDVFVRGALAESWTFVWYPLILAGVWETLTRRRAPWYLAPTLCGLMLTHTASFLYFALVYGAIAVASFWLEHRQAFKQLAVSLALATGFALWFLVPQLHGLSTVPAGRPELMWSGIAQVDSYRVSWSQLLDVAQSPAPGATGLEMHFDLGAAQLVLPVLLGLLLLPSVRKGARPHNERRRRWLVLVLAGTWVWSLCFMVAPRRFLQVLPSAFSYIQFPWRLLGLAAFLASAVLGIAAAGRHLPRWVPGLVVAGSVLAVLLVPGYQRSPAVAAVDAGVFADSGFARATALTAYTDLAEYRPIEIASDRLPDLPTAPRVIGDGQVERWTQGRRSSTADITMRTPGTLVLPVLFYDFYQVRSGAGTLGTFSADGLLAVKLPAGPSTLTVNQRLTSWSWLGLAGTVLSVAFYASCLVNRRRRADRPGRVPTASA